MNARARGLWMLVGGLIAAPWVLRTASAETPGREEEVSPEDSSSASAPPSAPEVPSAAPSAAGSAGPLVDGMIRIPGAGFTMGSADPKAPANERPRHAEVVASFWLDRTEVTVERYRTCVESHGCARPAKSSATCTYDQPDAVVHHLPVSCVHWREADAFCRAMGKRLPREAEWELAAKGKRGGRYPWGGGPGCFFAATLVGDATGRTCTKGPSPVGSHGQGVSPYGVMDLSGNVEEWTSDWYVENVTSGSPAAAGASHVLRGGGWLSAPSMSRATSRNWGSSMEAGPNVGFRCARD